MHIVLIALLSILTSCTASMTVVNTQGKEPKVSESIEQNDIFTEVL